MTNIGKNLQSRMDGVRVSPRLRAQTLAAMREQEERRPHMKRKISTALAMALVCVLAGAAALAAANYAGVFDFLGRYQSAYIPEDAQAYVQRDVSLAEDERFTSSVREAVYDGRTLRLTVDVKPKDEQALLIGTDMMLGDNWQNLVRLTGAGWDASDTRTVLDIYRERGYTSVYSVNIWTEDTAYGRTNSSMDYTLCEDGTLTLFVETSYPEDRAALDVSLNVSLLPIPNPEVSEVGDRDSRIVLKNEFTLQAAQAGGARDGVLVSRQPIDFESIGVRVTGVRMEVKPLEIYYTIDYTVVDRELYKKTNDGLSFEFIDPNSTAAVPSAQRLADGPSGSSSAGPINPGEDWKTAAQFRQTGTLGLNELADRYTLRAYDCWEKTRFDTVTVEMGKE